MISGRSTCDQHKVFSINQQIFYVVKCIQIQNKKPWNVLHSQICVWGSLNAFKTIRCAFKTSYESQRL